MAFRVARLSTTPVKGTGLTVPGCLDVGAHGVVGDRLFYLIGPNGRLVNGRRWGPLVEVTSQYDARTGDLSVRLPDGRALHGAVRLGDAVSTNFFDHDVAGHVVLGPWAGALSELAGRELRLVQVSRPSLGVDLHPVTLVSTATLDCLAADTEASAIEFWRRFRLNVEVSGPHAHAEDLWAGTRLRSGSVVLEVIGPVPRCVVVRQDPFTGHRDADVLRDLLRHGERVHGSREHPREPELGVYARVIRPGRLDLDAPIELEAGPPALSEADIAVPEETWRSR